MLRIEFPESACALATTHDGRIVVVEQWRRLHQKLTLELAGGIQEDGESPTDAAVREFHEETGLDLADGRPLMTLDMDFSGSIHKTHVCTGRLADDEQEAVPGRGIAAVRFLALVEAIDLIVDGVISHAPTVAAILWMASAHSPIEGRR